VTTKWQRFTISVPDDFKPKDRARVADKAIDSIVKRTVEKGKDKNNKKFVAYTKDYAKQKGQRRVDLVKSFSMLTNIQQLQSSKGRIVIGFTKGSKENGKADGNIRGTFGKSKPITRDDKQAPGRDFLGLPTKALNAIIEIVGAGIEKKDKGDE